MLTQIAIDSGAKLFSCEYNAVSFLSFFVCRFYLLSLSVPLGGSSFDGPL